MAHAIVLRHQPDATQPYVTHMRVIPEGSTGTTPYYVHGHYFHDLLDACQDFAERAADRIIYHPEVHNV